MKSTIGLLGLLVAAAPASGCASPEGAGNLGEEAAFAAQEVVAAPTAYLLVTSEDLRRCAAPLCGGWFVRAVNQPLTTCADGTAQTECHVFDLDLSSAGLDHAQARAFEGQLGAGHAIVRGSLSVLGGPYGPPRDVLRVEEAWRGVAQSTPSGDFYRVTSSGIVCITTPCSSYREDLLNRTQTIDIAEVDLRASGASSAEAVGGYIELGSRGILVAGRHEPTSGPAGIGTLLVASEFYTRVTAGVYPCGATTCGLGQYCCSSRCGICAPVGAACIQEACD